MTTSNKILRQLERQKRDDVASLQLLSRDLEAYLKGPKEVKVKDAPKYVTGVTKSQGDEEYASNIRAFGSKQLGRVFGMNMGMSAIQQEVLNTLEAKFGSGAGTREFVDLATQVTCHLLIQAATHLDNVTAMGDATTGLKALKDAIVTAIESRSSIVAGIEAAEGIQSASYSWLRPLNLVHIERVDARFSPRLRSRDDMLNYIINPEAQRAVIRHIANNPSIPDDVLLPAALTSANTVAAAVTVFAKYPAKDVAATYAFYSKAVRENLDTKIGLQVGDVKASLDGAAVALRDAASAMRLTGVAPSVAKVFEGGFRHIASELGRINVASSEADEDIAFAVADLALLLGAYDNVGEGTAALSTDKLQNSGLDAGTTLGDRVKTIMESERDKYVGSASFSEADIAFLDARDEICPKDINDYVRGNPRFRDVINNLTVAIINMVEAHNLLVPVGAVTAGRPTGLTSGTLEVTQGFANIVAGELTRFQTFANDIATATTNEIVSAAFDAAMFEAYEQLLGARGLTNLTTTCQIDVNDMGNATANTWSIPMSRLNQIASGDAPTIKSPGVEDAIVSKVDAYFRQNAATVKQRRSTRDFALRAASMLSDTIASLRVQAQNTGVAIQVRKNPMLSKGQIAGYAAGSLVGSHAVSALANRFVKPASGTMMSHVVDYAPSLAVAGYGAYKASQGDKDVGYSLAGGAIGHILLRCAFTKYPALRFSENPVLKALQAPTNGLAHLLGDESMGASALTPASVQGKEDVNKYVLGLVNANDIVSLCYIAVQLCKSGIVLGKTVVGQFTVGNVVENPSKDSCVVVAERLIELKCVIEACGFDVVCETVCGGKPATDEMSAVLASTECTAALVACNECMDKICADMGLSGFILEPGYNMNVYSGEDQVSYLQPAPRVTSQPGMVQLEDAISRARRLGPQELLQEGIGDLTDVAIILAAPSTARMVEQNGMGTSLGHSRMNPGHELVALEVEGANGLWPVAPERQHSVPQGALNYAKIGHAEDVSVSAEGLFTRGTFTPMYGR
jgi:hypothetical protein